MESFFSQKRTWPDVVGTDPGYVRRTNAEVQLSPASPELQVHTTLADTIEACSTAIRASR